MSLGPGDRLGPYEIVSSLGAGGMGEVYRAHDTRLQRQVALKVLPDGLAAAAGARERFEREARAAAALSHPNIMALFDVGFDDGTAYAVCELLEGQTLAEVLKDGPPPQRKAIEWAGQLARGLAAAHDRGLVHRDLKPANVFITGPGRVKILDFGLAKEIATPGNGDALTASPTVAATEPGAVLGTVGYMAPEQVRGEPADARSDLFAFGVVLYEMLSGRRPFGRDTGAESMTAILRDDPPPLGEVGVRISPALTRVVERCLEKRPEERFQSARDLAFAIENASFSSAGGENHAAEAVRTGPRPARGLPAWGWALVALVAGAAWFAGARFGGEDPRRSPTDGQLTHLTLAPGAEVFPSVSPDGSWLVYARDDGDGMDLYQLRVGGENQVLLTPDSPSDDSQPAVSPDGELIAFHSERQGGGLFVMGATGESVRRLTSFGSNPAWSPDGRWIAFATEPIWQTPVTRSGTSQVWIVGRDGGEPRKIYDGDGVQPSFSPDGSWIAVWGLQADSGQRDLWAIPVRGGDAVRLTEDPFTDWAPHWARDGHLYFLSDRGGAYNVWRARPDPAAGIGIEHAEAVTSGVMASPTGVSVSADGRRLIFAAGFTQSNIHQVDLDLEARRVVGPPRALTVGNQSAWGPDLSPDGAWLAYATLGTVEEISLTQIDGRSRRALASSEDKNRMPRWSPDGRSLAFYSDRSGRYEIWSVRPDGSGLQQVTPEGDPSAIFPAWSPDGLQMTAVSLDRRGSLYTLGADGRATREEQLPDWPEEGLYFEPFDWSRDGKLGGSLRATAGGRSVGIAVLDLTTREFRKVSDFPGLYPVWAPDNRLMLAGNEGGVVHLIDSESGELTPILSAGWRGNVGTSLLDVAPDGKSVLYAEHEQESDLWMLEIPE